MECFNEAYEANELSISQRRGIITLIPKGNGSPLDLSNWRPITLLNVDCKIATKAIAKRIESSLPKLVNLDQTGFIKGRYIGENIRLIIDTMEFTKKHNIPGILVSLDFRKAFDSLEWPFMMRTLNIFNFGTSIQRWVRTFYTNIESAALNNGFLTNWFRPSRGVRQGCPLSPYLFILSAELMANKIRQDLHVKGIEILGNELKLSQYVDDKNLFCADLTSVEKALEIVDSFGTLAGLKLNRKKTKAIWLGKWENCKSNPLQLKWLHNPAKISGIYVSYDEKETTNITSTTSCKNCKQIWTYGGHVTLHYLGGVKLAQQNGIKLCSWVERPGKKIFYSLKNTCKETKLKEFQFKLIHRIVVTKKELFRYGIKTDDECLYCGEHDSIDHTFVDCEFVKNFVKNVINWFNAVNNSNFTPTMDEKVFGIMSGPYDKTLLKRFNYTTLYMRYYVYTCKMQNKAIHLPMFVSKVLYKYRLENLS